MLSSDTKPKMTLRTLPAAHNKPTSGPPYDTRVSSLTDERRISRTIAIGLRREPQPPMPSVMPSRSSATISAVVVRLSTVPPGSSRAVPAGPGPPAPLRGPGARASRRSYLIRSVSKRAGPAARRPGAPGSGVGHLLLRPGDGLACRARPGARRDHPRGRADPSRRARAAQQPARARLRPARRARRRSRHDRPPERDRVLRCLPRDLEARRHAAADLRAPARARAPRDPRPRTARPGTRRRTGRLPGPPDPPGRSRARRVARGRPAPRRRAAARALHDLGRQHRAPEADPRALARCLRPRGTRERHAAGRHDARPGAPVPRGTLHHELADAPRGPPPRRHDALRRAPLPRAGRGAPHRLGALRADDDAAHLAPARGGARPPRPLVA